MKSLARKTIALAAAAALAHGALPPAAFCVGVKASAAVEPAAALRKMREWGVYKNGDVLQTYLGDQGRLTPLGLSLYLSLANRYNAAEEVEGLKPVFDRLRENGPYDARRAGNVERAVKLFEQKFGRIDDDSAGSLEDQFMRGAQREALMTGAAVNEPPKPGDLSQVQTEDGFEFWDKKGLAYRLNNHQATTYNRELQKAQRQMNLSRPAQASQIPETGRYNFEMFDYSRWRLKNQYEDLVEGLRRDRLVAIAELLGEANKFRSDMWLADKTLEADLLGKARRKNYRHRGKDYNLLQLVDAKFAQRQYYLDGSLQGVSRYEADMNQLKAALKADPTVTDAQVRTLSLDEQYSLRFLSLAVLETQMFYVRNQSERLDPASPDSAQVMKALDDSTLPAEVKANYKARAREMVERLKALSSILERTRKTLEAADYAGSLDMANSALSSSQRELGELSADYSMFVEIPAVAHLGQQQTDVRWLNFGSKLTRGVYRAARPGCDYAQAMRSLEAGRGEYDALIRTIAAGDLAAARRGLIAMNPGAVKQSFEASLGGSPGRITDAARLAASLKVNRDRIGTVFETNKWLDTAGNYITWTVSLALAAPTARWGLNGVAGKLARFTNLEAAAGSSMAARAGVAMMRRGSIIISETARHTAARLETLDPSRAWVQSRAETAVGRFLLAGSVRGLNAGVRQASFSSLSGGISGAFVLGFHLWDQAALKVGGRQVLKPGHSMFSGDLDGAAEAFWTGVKGGVWWANETWHPGLGYVGLPSTVYRGMRVTGAMDMVAARGVAGATLTGAKSLLGKAGLMPAAAEGGLAAPGLLERMAATGAAGKAGAFAFGMADNVAKYALFSQAAGWVGRQYGYYMPSMPVAFLHKDLGGYAGVADTPGTTKGLERRVKGAHAVSQKWLESPAWLLIPTFAAHQARDAVAYMRSKEGVEQYDRNGLTHEYANAEEGAQLRFMERPKIPFAQRIFETSFFSDNAGEYWIVTKDVRREGIRKELVRSLGGEKATPADINPLEFYYASKLADGEKFINLKAGDEFRLIAHQDFIEGLLADPARAKRVLDAKLGTTVENFGRVTPEVQKDVAVALYSSELQTGKPMPKLLQGRVGEILKPYLEANESVKPYAEGFIDALKSAPSGDGFKAALDGICAEVTKWKQGGQPYTEFLVKLREDAAALKSAGKISAPEHEVLAKMYDYVESIERRFNSFNNVEKAQGLASETLSALKTEFSGRAGPTKVLDGFTLALDQWASGRGRADAVDGPKSDGSFRTMLAEQLRQLRAAKATLSPSEFAAMKGAVDEMASSPWVLHDSKGTALPGWRPEQFEGFMSSLAAYAEQGRGGAPVRIFQLLKTGGGKTMLTFEGLLPLAEADAAAHAMKPMFLTVQSNLEAQARMEFIAFKKIGSKLDFDTYEGFKTKIAEGKTKGRNALRDYWILGDEMDGAALQPALTIGEVTGRVTKLNPIYNRMEELDNVMGSRIERIQSGQANKALTEARRAGNNLSRLEGPDAQAVKAEGVRLEGAARELVEAQGPRARHSAEAGLRQSAQRLEGLLDALPSSQRKIVEGAHQNLARMKSVLSEPATDARARRAMVNDLEAGFARQKNLLELTGSERGLSRLAVEARRAVTALEVRAERLEREAAAAEGSQAPGASERARALREELSLVRRELGAAQRFDAVDSGLRLAHLQERIAGAEGSEGAPVRKLSGWKSAAAEIEQTLPAERKAACDGHAEALRKIYETGRELNRVNDEIHAAAREGRPTEELQTRRAALESDYGALQGEAQRYKAELSAGASSGDLGGMSRRLAVLSAEEARLDGQVQSAKIRGERAGPQRARLAEVRAEIQTLDKRTQSEVRRRFDAAADEITAEVGGAKPGWEDRSLRLLEQRRRMLTAYAGDENPVYTVFREMKEDMRSFAMNERLRSPDPQVYEPVRDALLRQVDGQALGTFGWKLPKFLWRVFTGKEVGIPINEVGLTRLHAAKLLKALYADPTMPAHQRDNLFWNVAPSLLWPKGPGGKSSSWVRTELLRQLHGFYEDPAGIRLDGRTKHINVVHNGQWFESMDNETRRFWELEYGVDLTLPYTNQAISTIKDVTTDKKARFISFSGTAGEKLRDHFEKNKIKIVGVGSKPPDVVELDVVTGGESRFKRIGQALANMNSSRGEVLVRSLDSAPEGVREAVESKIGGPLKEPAMLKLADFAEPKLSEAREWLTGLRRTQGDADHVVLRRADAVPAGLKPAVDAYLAASKLAGKEDAVVRISEVQSDAAQAWLRELRANQKDTGLVVLSVSDTRVLKTVREHLLRGGLKPDEISMVFSDAEYLRNNVPEAEVAKQMNLGALDQGKARVLILDTRVGGRGLDLNFKGERGNLDPKAFRGYTDFEMLLVDPQKMSSVHLLQAEGRIDVGRVLPAASREFSLVMDVKSVQGERIFREMVKTDPFFDQKTGLRSDPVFQKYASEHKIVDPDWATFHQYVRERLADPLMEPGVGADVARARARELAVKYKETVKRHLERQQAEVEMNQLRSSSVETDAPITVGRFPGIEGMR
ncbi:MAG: hypothetical protein A2X40_05940 [Elusimicrobia bacterium GWC2_65_9]|nr:MAG: hypothetical protein A2X37_02310 [Elusimicrobia bacterium GWA2_66_18]OGR70854.1 MAG: hypothetical protein A2X40_05940 [Elusimicrobia bacterium GWC2_65_9]